MSTAQASKNKFDFFRRNFKILWILGSKVDSLGAGRCPNGFVSKFCFRWASGEPVTTILDPKQAPGQCPLPRLNLQCVAKSDIGLLDTQDIALLETRDIALVETRNIALVETQDTALLETKSWLQLFVQKPESVACGKAEMLLVSGPERKPNHLYKRSKSKVYTVFLLPVGTDR